MGSLARRPSGKQRIGIVGAGASGLAVAHALQRRGYRHIALIERQPRLGGKCCTISYEGRSYELGAAALSLSYRNVRALMSETGLRATAALATSFVDVEDDHRRHLPLPRPRQWGGLGRQAARLGRELWRHRDIRRPGFEQVGDELCMPFQEWCSAHGVEQMGELVKPLVTGFGYGFYGEVPAAYVLKYLNLITMPLFEIREGFGTLWERVARSLSGPRIFLATTIERVTRQDDQVRVYTDHGTFDFDALVLACPFDEAATFLDVTPAEAELFSRIHYYDYYVVAALTADLPRVRCLFWPRHFDPEHVGLPMFAYQRWPGRGLTCFYGFARNGSADALPRAAVAATVDRLGGSVRAMPVTKRWRYFPHVTCEDMAAGFYTRLEALQGHRATYYCGELLALGTVETVVDYARALVARHFV
jgi:hypothetical protein